MTKLEWSASLSTGLHRREQFGRVEAEFVDSHVEQAEIRRRRLERRQRPVAEQLFEARSLEDPVGAAEGQRAARDAADRFADDIFRAIEGGGGCGRRAF